MVRRKSTDGVRGQASQLPKPQQGLIRSVTRFVTLEMDASPSVARRVPVPKPRSSASPGKSSPQPPATAAPHRTPSSASITISHLKATTLIPEFVDKTMDYRPVALRQSHGERILCERVRTSADHYGLHDATYTAGLPDGGRSSPTQRSPQRRPTQKGDKTRSRSVDQLIVGTPKWGTMSSDSQGLDFENWREGEREDAWDGSKLQDAFFGLERQRRGWLYVHTSKVHSLKARYWKKMFIVLETDLTFYNGVVRDSNLSSGGISNDVEGAGVGFCLKSSDCLHLSAQVFDTQWPFGIQLEVPTGTMRVASSSEKERDEWLHLLRLFFAGRGQSPAEILPMSPTFDDTPLSPSRFSTRHLTTSSMPPATAGEIVRDLARDTLAATQPISLLRVKTTSGRALVHVDDSINWTRKVFTRHRTAAVTRPMSRWSEEGLDVQKKMWMDEVTMLRARGEDEFSATEALHKGIPYARRGVLVDALSKSAHLEDAHNVQVRLNSCQAMQRQLKEIDSQVQQMHKDLDSPAESPVASHRTSEESEDDLFAEFTTDNSERPHLSKEEQICCDMVQIFTKRWVDNAMNEVGGILKWRSLTYVEQLAAIYTSLRDANDIGQILKDVPGSDPSKMSVTVTYVSVPKLVADIVIIATKLGERSKAMACLESIFDDDLRAETINRVYEIAQRLWMDDLVTDLFKRGHVKERRDIKRAGTPSLPTRKQVLPQTASDALVRHAKRKQQQEILRALSAAERPIEVVVDMGEEHESSDEEPDVLAEDGNDDDEDGQQQDGEENDVEEGEECEPAETSMNQEEALEGEEAPKKRSRKKKREEKMRTPYWLADEESLKLVQEVKNLIDSKMHTKDLILKLVETHGHTLTNDFVDDIRERMELESLTSGMSHDHPVRIRFSRLMNEVTKMTFEAWLAFSRTCQKHRYALTDQYISACKYNRVVPTALSTVSKFIKSKDTTTLDLSQHGLTKHSMAALMEAITASKAYLGEKALDVNFVRERLGDDPITVLDVSQNDLQESGCGILMEALLIETSNWCLTTLKLGSNNLRDGGCLALLALFSSERIKLQHLSINKNAIGDKALAKLAKAIEDDRNLLSLDISENRAETNAGIALGQMIRENVSLTYLDCSSNMLRGSGAQAVAEALGDNDVMLELNLAWNGFGDQGPCGALASSIERCFNLKVLNIGYNRINLRGATALAGHLENNGNIGTIILDGNPIGMAGIRVLMKAAKKAGENKDFPPELSLHNCEKGTGLKSAFDPQEPAGDYEIDMADGFSGGVLKSLLKLHAMSKGFFVALDQNRAINMELLKIMARPPPNAMLDDQRYTIALPSYESTDDDGNPCRVVNPDESEWKIPSSGLLRFKFASVRVRDRANDFLDAASYQHLQDAFQNPKNHHKERAEAMDLYIANDTLVSFQQVQDLLQALQWNMGDRELAETRGTFVAKCYHKLDDSTRASESLDILDHDARVIAEKILGVASMAFTRNNPTGHYRLRLNEKIEREICLRLIECRGEQAKRLTQMEEYYKKRTPAGKRDAIERVWRNCKFDKRPMDFDMSWKVPDRGTIEFDFVSLLKPKADEVPWSDQDFFARCVRELEHFLKTEEEARFVAAVRRWSETMVFSCKQVRRLLRRLKTPLARVELVITCFGRTVDWHAFKYIQHELSVNEFKELRHRVGLLNLWDESVACDYYELELSDPEQRWICQEVLHLGAEEPGENMGECMYEGVDYTITKAWLSDCPRKGLLQVYYNREARIIRKIREQGAWDHDKSVFYKDGSVTNNNQVTFPDSSFECGDNPIFMPTWLMKYSKDSQGPLHEPPDHDWIREHKLRRIVSKLKEKFPSPKAAMKKLDRDGGGDLDRKEIARGLFEMGIWLHPDETKAMFEAIDEDDGGTVDQDEFFKFWNDYDQNKWVDDDDDFPF